MRAVSVRQTFSRAIAATLAVAVLAVGLALVSGVAVEAQQTPGQLAYPVFRSDHITSNTTRVLMTGAGLIHTVCVNTKGGSSNTVKVYSDATGSGTNYQLAIIDSTVTPGCWTFDVVTSLGITIVVGTGTAPDITVSYRPLN